MRIAIVSYEYPPDTARGGVARCTHDAARLLAARGHDVEVFAGSPLRQGSWREDDVLVHRVRGDYIPSLEPIGEQFARRHRERPFDVLEGPELDTEAAPAVRMCPDVPLLVRLHSATMLIWDGNRVRNSPPRWPGRIITSLQMRRRGFAPYWAARDLAEDVPPVIRAQDVREREHAHAADLVVAPSAAVRQRTVARWGLDPDRVRVIPNVFTPDPALTQLPAGTSTAACPTVAFIGRLEPNKGVIDLALAIPRVLARSPQVRFRLVGESYSAAGLGDTLRYLRDGMLASHARSVEFDGPLAAQAIPGVLAAADVVVIPSIWDNLPFVCLEAMAAGRAIVATDSGGMRELLDREIGWLVPAHDPDALAAALLDALADPTRRVRAGEAARRRLADDLAPERVVAAWEDAYREAIARAPSRSPRWRT